MTELFHPSAVQLDALAKRGISPEWAIAMGLRTAHEAAELPEGTPERWREYLPAILIPWTAEDGRVEWQIRPDTPVVTDTGDVIKYATRSRDEGYRPVLWVAKRGSESGSRLLVEGTCQTLAAARYAPEDVWVLGMVGCRGWMSDGQPIVDLGALAGASVIGALDADLWTNVDVWDAGELLQRALAAEGASAVTWLKLPASKKNGLDDVLGNRPEATRAGYLERLIQDAIKEKFPKSRRPKPSTKSANPWFGETGLLAEQATKHVLRHQPAALTAENRVALYREGVFEISGQGLARSVLGILGDQFRPGHLATIEQAAVALLWADHAHLPDLAEVPLLNCRNGMVDLRTGELMEHDPAYSSSWQLPVKWNPEATAPVYERWLKEVANGQADDLEESVSVMLDPSRRPTKAVFLFGPTRSGKSTFLKLVEKIVGERLRSAVTLHQLASDQFAAARLYGKRLNVAADLSSAHVDDLSVFKMLTGEDSINANPKFGTQFTFKNQALFLFSANRVPTVSESSDAYRERIRPFDFPVSFAGHEDLNLWPILAAELEGILVRLVAAWQRFNSRGTYREQDNTVLASFRRHSDRVQLFVDETCTVVDNPQKIGKDGNTPTDIAARFNDWAREQGAPALGRNKLIERIRLLPGVIEFQDSGTRVRGLNVAFRDRDDWGIRAVLNLTRAVSEMPENDTIQTESNDQTTITTDPFQPTSSFEAKTARGSDVSPPGDRAVRAVSNPIVPTLEKRNLVDLQNFLFSQSGDYRASKLLELLAEGPSALLNTRALSKIGQIENCSPGLSRWLSRSCPRCGTAMTYVPPARFWVACPSCYPETFNWRAEP